MSDCTTMVISQIGHKGEFQAELTSTRFCQFKPGYGINALCFYLDTCYSTIWSQFPKFQSLDVELHQNLGAMIGPSELAAPSLAHSAD